MNHLRPIQSAVRDGVCMMALACSIFPLWLHAAADETVSNKTWSSGTTTITGTNSVTTSGTVVVQGTANVTFQSQGIIRLTPGFRATSEGGAKFRAANTTNQARFISWDIPTSLSPGEVRQIKVTFNNYGGTTWTSTGGYKLGSQAPTDTTRWGLSRVALPASTPPGQNVTFTFNITAPLVADAYDFQWGMLQETIQWFANFTPASSIRITNRPQDDTNGDGMTDAYTRDTNGNGIPDAIEISLGLNPNNPSTPSGRSDNYQYDNNQRLISGPGGTYSQDAESNITGR